MLGRRRVAGLRREEVAMLAALASDRPRARRRTQRREVAPPSTARSIQSLAFPAFIEGRHLDVLAANEMAAALSPCLALGRNRLHDVFLDPGERALLTDWHAAGAALVAGFRRSVGTEIDDPRVVDLVGELSLASADFATLWARHDVGPRTGASLTLDHPRVGDLRLEREKLAITGTHGAMLVVYHPQPDSDGAEKLAFLASAAPPRHHEAPAGAPARTAPPSGEEATCPAPQDGRVAGRGGAR